MELKPMTTPANPTPDKLVDLRVAHLNMIQGVISRMSGFSAGVKNFCVTISAAIIAVAYQKQIPMLVWAAVAVVVIFCIMDTYYLGLERRYRELYEDVAARPFDQASNMSLKSERLNFSTCFRALRSNSVAGFYTLLLIGIVTLLNIANHVQPQPTQTAPVSHRGATRPAAKRVGDVAGLATRAGADGRTDKDKATPAERAQPFLDANTNTTGVREPVRTR
ncbi:MAG: hypothetical protein QOJ91_1615 [Sphingomonadales bacterium]|jgi:hypothetical protein|nr:hypothetical protein [Sphingomonadales bacterium]